MKIAFEKPAVYLITKGEATAANFAEKRKEILNAVRSSVDAGVTFVQLREKNLTSRLVYELACEAAALTRGSATRLLVNDRADIAFAAGADGVQLTSVSVPASVAREAYGPEFVIGVSAHAIEELKTARDEGADFALFGPVFETPGKGAGKGVDELKRACEAVMSFPVLAIGGVSADNYRSVIDAGAAGFAAIRWLNDVDSLTKLDR